MDRYILEDELLAAHHGLFHSFLELHRDGQEEAAGAAFEALSVVSQLLLRYGPRPIQERAAAREVRERVAARVHHLDDYRHLDECDAALAEYIEEQPE